MPYSSVGLFPCHFLTGLGYIAILPPFEGIDEPGHFSNVRQIADTRTIPYFGESFLDKAYTNYRGPRSYEMMPPYDVGMVYSSFFKHPGLSTDYRHDYRQAFMNASFEPGEEANHEVQQPPLYYGLLAPFSLMVAHSSLVMQIFFMRLISYLFAIGGVFFGLLALKGNTEQKEQALLVFTFISFDPSSLLS